MADIREALSQKYDSMMQGEQTSTPAPEVVEKTSTPVPDAAAQPPSADAKDSGRARDDAGRFAKSSTPTPPGDKPAASPPAIEGQGAAVAPTTPATAAPASPETPPSAPAKTYKPPQSWKPHIREKWATLPTEVQEEAERLDREYQKVMRDAAEARKMASAAQQTLAPYEGLARANGMDSVKYAGSVLQTAAALHMGTPQQKAAIVAQLIGSYGIDVDAVNAVMQGQAPAQAAQPPPQRPVDVRGEVQRMFQEFQTQQLTAQAQSAIEKAKAGAEFWNDVGEGKIVNLAATLINSEPNLAADVALRNAYDILSTRTPEISAVLKQRQEAEAAKARIASTQQAQAAAGSIRSQPAAVSPTAPKGLRDTLERWKGWTA